MGGARSEGAGLTPARVRPGTGRWLGILVVGAGLLGAPLAMAAARRNAVPICFGKRATVHVEPSIDGREITGTDGNDVIAGTAGPDKINGGGGNDLICGLAQDDIINGGAGHDRVSGGPGLDVIDGAEGNDGLYGDEMNDDLDGGPGNDHLFGGSGDDLLRGGEGADSFHGGAGLDSCRQETGDTRRSTCENDNVPDRVSPAPAATP